MNSNADIMADEALSRYFKPYIIEAFISHLWKLYMWDDEYTVIEMHTELLHFSAMLQSASCDRIIELVEVWLQ